ncbi:MAG: nitrite/sulfite reductase, partial [Rhodospirillales bacterium]|nr:nitrite/sulfite reductase [Rhodospirillales bacterium]
MLKTVSNDQAPIALVPSRFHAEPLALESDVEEFKQAHLAFKTGSWDDDRWKTFRLRFGVYAELAPGKHMLRVKIPGGRLSFAWAKALAEISDTLCNGHIHLTTRQDVQIYGVSFDGLPGVIEALNKAGLTTRESSGATFRNVTACPMAGICPSEHVDAGKVAEKLTTSWLRNPLVQHMPRKFKTAVSGCAQDCGSVSIDDLGFIATVKDGKNGFRVLAGGGLGTHPRLAVEVMDFVTEEDLQGVQEAMAKLHHKYSDRTNRAKSRLKFLVDRFGKDRFVELFLVELKKVQGLVQRPSQKLDWRSPEETGKPVLPGGRIAQTDGKWAAVVRPAGGSFDPQGLLAVTALAEELGGNEFRITRDQNLVATGFGHQDLETFTKGAEEHSVRVIDQPKGADNTVSCPGTSTCPIGITNSSAFAKMIAEDSSFEELPQTRIRISGCHNSCGQHHVADFGLHGMGKKIKGRPAPHYQFHIGGLHEQGAAIGLGGPIVPAKKTKEALHHLISNYVETAEVDEGVRAWADRKGKGYFKELLQPFGESVDSEDPATFVDFGKVKKFRPPASTLGECSAPAVIAEYLADLAEVGRDDLMRFLSIGDVAGALASGHNALLSGARRLLAVASFEISGLEDEAVLAQVRIQYPADKNLLGVLETTLEAEKKAEETGDFS